MDKLRKLQATADTHVATYLDEAREILGLLDVDAIGTLVERLVLARDSGGRLFFVGSGGGAANASHAVNDFRKLAGFEAYCPSDNVSELTARVNDEGWDRAYEGWLRASRFSGNDLLFVFSVGGGDSTRNISPNLVRCLELAQEVGATICGVVGRDGGETAQLADACVVVPVVNPANVTPHTEAFQAVIWHLLVSHPALQTEQAKWESVS